MGRFVGVGIDTYEGHGPLAHAVAEVKAVAEVLGAEFTGVPLLDPDQTQVTEYLEAVPGSLDTGSLVLLWCGHGVLSRSRLRLPTRRGEIDAAEVIYQCAGSGANQLLFIVDTCRAGAGVGDASTIASALLEEVSATADHAWFGILVSCSATDIGARDGAFGAALLRLLKEGPQSADMRRRWSRHNRLIRGDDLGQALLEDWTGEDQRPDFLRRGSAWYMLPNPLWELGAPEEVVEHLLLAARGGTSAEHRSWFTGRDAEVNQVVSWVAAPAPGVRVVTGSAGTGKSAIVGRVVSLSNPAERSRLERDGSPWAHADPGERSVASHVHARGLTAERMAELLDGHLVRSGVLAPGDGDRRNAAELIGALQRAADAGARPPVLVVDGLDEARGEMFAIAADLLVRLAPYASLVVSTRPVTRPESPPSLIAALQADSVLDLDDPVHRASGRAALRGYVVARLSGVASEMDPTAVADRLVGESSQTEDRPFLLGRVVTDQLRAVAINTSTPSWERYLAHSIESAFDVDLARITPPGMGIPPGTSAAGLARTMLTALTWAFGAGFPEEEWIVVASRLAGIELGRDHVSWVLDGLGRFVVQDGEGGTAVYRVAHQSLADHLRPSYRRSGERPFDPAAEPVWAVLAARYATLITSGLPATAPTYLWRYAHRHAAAVGVDGLPALRDLASAADELQPDIALAALEVAEVSATWGHRADAVAPTEEAVALYRELAAENPAYVPDLAMALNNLGAFYSGVGRRADAVAPTEEAVALRRAQAAENPAYAPDLAMALNNLGLFYSGVGRRADAVGPTEEAVALYRELAAENPAYAPDLATALNNLGKCYSEVGRRADAVAPTEEAVALYRELAADNPAYAPDLATALNNLGLSYSEVGRRADAGAPTEEAVALRRAQAAENPAYAPDLAMALNNLGAFYSGVGRRADAVAPTEEAVALYRELAADNPAYAPDLATALNNLDRHLVAVGDSAHAEAVWQEVLGEYDPLTRSTLLLRRAAAANSGDPRAAAWLVEACRSDDRGLLGAVHESARTHRAANPESWGAAWIEASGAQPPEWLTVDTDLLAVATAWISTSTYADERDHLAAHPELIEPHADIVIEEALLRVDENDADRYRQLRIRCRAEGVDATYRPLFLLLLADQFSAASPSEQRELLTERRPELLDDLVRQHLDSRGQADDTGEAIQAVALLDIAAEDTGGSILMAAFDALDHPSGFPELLDATARDAESVATVLQSLATIAFTAATTQPEAAMAALYLAIAAAVAGDQERATELISQALAWDPESASAWIARLAQLGAVQPSVLPLITVLAEGSHGDEH